MGQTLGKAQVKPAARPFVNLPKSLVESLSDCVHEVAEGFGLSVGEVKQIAQVSLHEYFSRLSESDLDECSEALFALFAAGGQSNSDGALVDSFELLATICLASGMQLHEKLDFLFTLFDINEAEKLTINEATLAFRTLAAGAANIADSSGSIDVEAIDRVALEAFELSAPDRYLMDSQALEVEEHSLTKQQFSDYVFNCAETLSLLNHFDDLLDAKSTKSNPSLETESAKLAPLRFHVTAAEQSPAAEEPWRDQLRFFQLNNDEETSPLPPTDALKMDWAYGRNAQTPSRYCTNGDVLFAAGSMVVKASVATGGNVTQEYFLGHSGHVASIDAFHSDGSVGDIVASADVGDNATICVWSVDSLSLIVAMPCFHESGTAKLCFSPSGDLLLSLGNDATPSVAVYNWREKRVLFTSQVPGAEVYDCSFLGSDDSFGVCSDDAVHFWTRSEPNVPYARHRGVFNRLSTEEPMTSIACVGGAVITGSLFGRLWMWEGRVCTKLVDALRSGPVTGLHAPRTSNDAGLCVSTHGGSVLLLDADLNIQHRLAPNKGFDDSDRVIDCICWHPQLERLLVGQGGNSLFEMRLSSEGEAAMITAGHHGIAGIATLSQSIVTVGNDAIKVWGTTQHRVLRETSLEVTLACVAYNPQEDQIAVGFAADGARSSVDHSFAILNGGDLQVIHRGGNSVKTLTACAYCNDGKLLAFGSADTSIYIHKCTETDFPLLAKLRGHTSPICSLDFGCEKGSDTAAFLRSNSVGREAMFWTTRGKTQTPLSQRDTAWETQTCVYSASLEGAHSASHEQVHITSCRPLSTHGDETIVVGDSSGRVRIFSHPVPTSQALSLDYSGHSGPIQSIQVSPDRHAVYTLSPGDSCLFQWTHTSDTHWERGLPTAPLKSKPHATSNESSALDMQTMIDQMDSLDFNRSSKEKRALLNDHKPRPWTRSIVAPTNFTTSAGALPDSHLVLERIHGYNGKAKNGLHCLGDDTIVYSVGKTLVRYNVNEDKQAFCTTASSNISCLAVHQSESLCAIGQEEASPAIIIVDLKMMKPRAFLTGGTGGVVCLDIDDSAKLVVSVSSSQQLTVHDWKNGAAIASSQTYGLETLDVSFLRGSSNQFVECGVCFVRFWTLKGGSLSFEEVALNSLENHTQFYSSLGWNGDSLVVGTSSGDIIQFDWQQPGNRRIKAHQTAVTNISPIKDGFVSSSLDCVKTWSPSMRCLLSVNTEAIGTTHQISSLSWANGKVFVGTAVSEIYELSSNDGSNLNRDDRPLICSHSSSPVGLSVHANGTFATCGDDGVLRIWNPHDFQEHASIELTASSRACAFSPDAKGRMIAVGLGKPEGKGVVDGKWIILHLSADSSSQIVAERRDVRKHVTEIKWHSSGDRLAVGSFDKKICVYELATETKPAVSVDITLLSMIDLTSAPSHFDFSRDGKYLRVSSESNELHFLEAGPGLHIKEPSRLKDTEWETQTSVFGWNVQGVWQIGVPDIASLDCTVQDCPAIVSGDAQGTLRIHQHPCTSASAQFASYSAHLGPVGKVRWIPGGYAVSTGEQDNAVMVWRQEIDEGRADRLDVAAPKAPFDASKALSNDEAGCHSAVYDQTGQVVYPSSGNCIVFDKKQNCHEPQQSFQQHESTVTAICSSHSKQLLASGDATGVRVWDSQTCTEVAKLSDDRQQQISVLSFSPDDAKLVSVGSNGLSQQTICVWATLTGDWKDAHLAFHTLAGHEKVHFCLFDTNQSLVSGGSRNVNFWSEQNSTLVVSKGVLSQQCISDIFTCGAAMDDKLVTGTASGSLVVWEAKKIMQELPQAHNASVLSICACPEGVVSGCEEGVVVLWSKSLQKVAAFDTTTSSPSPPQPAICSIDITAHTSRRSTARILVRTRSGDILEVSCVTGAIISMVRGDLRLTEGPSAEQLGSID
ncbi:hypothetical protein ACHAXT_001304 [Thalassiosira profunda]